MITAYFDGASWPNPGPSGCGALLKRDGIIFWEYAEYLGDAKSNNYAEYAGICAILTQILDNSLNGDITIYGDSNMVIQQMLGNWKIKHPKPGQPPKSYIPKALEAKSLHNRCSSKGFRIQYVWIPREQNTEADALSTKTLEERGFQETYKPYVNPVPVYRRVKVINRSVRLANELDTLFVNAIDK